MRNWTRSARWAAAAFVAGAFGWASAAGAWAASPELVRAAKKEGRVVMYGVVPVSVLAAFTKAFMKRYPGIEAGYYRSNTGKTYEKYRAEARANRVSVDVIHLADPGLMEKLKEDGLLMPYRSPEYQHYAPRFVEPEGRYFIARAHLSMPAYNPTKLPGERAPKSWADLLRPELKGRVGIPDPRIGGGGYFFLFGITKVHGVDFFQKLRANQPKLYGGHGPIAQKIVSGEFYAGAILDYLVYDLQFKKKAPIAGFYPPEGVFMIQSPVGITAKAPHPNAAKLLMDYLASPEGQAAFNNTGYTYSLRPGVDPVPGKPRLSEIKVLDWSIQELRARHDEYTQATIKALAIR